MAVTQALIDGSGWHLTREGWAIIENFIVSGVNAGTNPSNMIFVAYQELVAFGVDINIAHAIVTTAFVTDIEPAGIKNDAVTFRVTFKEYERPISVIEVGNSVAQVETDKDSDGVKQTLSYDYPDTYEWNADLKGKTKIQPGLMSKILPEPSISITRREIITGQNLTAKKLVFEGKLNVAGWWLEPDAATKTWLCTGIGGRSQDNGLTYDVTYTFQYREDTWDADIRFIDPGTGDTPSDVVDGTGFKTVQIYKTADFNLLELHLT